MVSPWYDSFRALHPLRFRSVLLPLYTILPKFVACILVNLYAETSPRHVSLHLRIVVVSPLAEEAHMPAYYLKTFEVRRSVIRLSDEFAHMPPSCRAQHNEPVKYRTTTTRVVCIDKISKA